MAFPNMKFDDNLPSFLHHTDVQNYLSQYCHAFSLEKVIQVLLAVFLYCGAVIFRSVLSI